MTSTIATLAHLDTLRGCTNQQQSPGTEMKSVRRFTSHDTGSVLALARRNSARRFSMQNSSRTLSIPNVSTTKPPVTRTASAITRPHSATGHHEDASAMKIKTVTVPGAGKSSLSASSTTGSSEDEANMDLAFNLLDPIKLSLCQEHMTDGRYRHTRISSKKMRKRVVQKNGECNVSPSNVAKRRRRYLQDIFTTLVDIQWRWTLLVFAMSFICSWMLFAIVWWVIAYTHGDFDPLHLPDTQTDANWTPCVVNINSFTSCFLFSVETQHTIGYGSRHTTEQCPEAIFVMCIQSITGVMIQAFMVGIVFAKLSRPKKRTQTLMFSRNACLCLRDGEMTMLFRVGDMRKSHIIEAHVRAQLIRKRVTREGEVLPFFQYELDVGYDIGEDRIFFIWPMTLVHKINENSPLYDLSAHDLLREKFEIVVMLEGVIESTGMTTQARSSYLPNEILWGYRFEPLVTFNKEMGEYAVDYSLFNNTYQVNTPLYSARELDRLNSHESTPEHEGGGESESTSGPQHKSEEDTIIQVTPLTPVTPMSPLTPMTPTSATGAGSCALDLHSCSHAACDSQDAPASQPLLQDHDHV